MTRHVVGAVLMVAAVCATHRIVYMSDNVSTKTKRAALTENTETDNDIYMESVFNVRLSLHGLHLIHFIRSVSVRFFLHTSCTIFGTSSSTAASLATLLLLSPMCVAAV